MCGIHGVFGKYQEQAEYSASLFRYRGPDNTKTITLRNGKITQHRLAIIDTDQNSNQPLSNKDNSVHICFNGEIYNYKELRDILLLKGYIFETEGDTEVLLNAYLEWGIECIAKLSGMFAIAIIDNTTDTLYLVRDHAGIKPLFYTVDTDHCSFSSELKGITTLSQEFLELDYESIELFWILGFIPSPKTLFKKIKKVDTGTIVKISLSTWTKEESSYQLNLAKSHTIENALTTSVNRHLSADVPIGLFFSGGVDSTILAETIINLGNKMKSFSIKLTDRSDEDAIKQILARWKFPNSTYHFDSDHALTQFNKIKDLIDDPLSDASLLPTSYLAASAAREIKVALSGEGGDEYFLGYERQKHLANIKYSPKYKQSYLAKLYFHLPPFKGKRMIFRKLFQLSGNPYTIFLHSISPGGDTVDWKKALDFFDQHKYNGLDLDSKLNLEGDLLKKIDYATSYNSIEGRVPLLDPDMIQISNTYSSNTLLELDGKSVLKKHLLKTLPEHIVLRRKSGFSIPLNNLLLNRAEFKQISEQAFEELKGLNIFPKNLISLSTDERNQKYPYLVYSVVVLNQAINNHIIWTKIKPKL